MPAPSCNQAASTAFVMQDWDGRLGQQRSHQRSATSSTNLFEGLGVEASEGVVLNGIADLDGGAADLTVLDVGVTAYREIQNHRNLFPTRGAGEGVFH